MAATDTSPHGGVDLDSTDQPIEQRWRWSFHQRERNSKVLKVAAACARQTEELLFSARILSGDRLGITRVLLGVRLISGLDALCSQTSFGTGS